MAVYTEEIQKLYVAYFNRPADYEGLAHWERVLTANNGNVDFVSSFFAQSSEYKDQVAGKSYFQIVNQIYNNLFNRDADIDGLNFWAEKLRAGTFTVDQIVKVIADTASDTEAKDKTTYNNKVKAAAEFTAALNSASEIIGYGNEAANNAAKVWLSTIGDDASYAAATAPAALAATVTTVTQTGTQAGGQTSALTKGLDVVNGTSGSDTIIGSIDSTANSELNTLSSVDIINGGTGIDFLKIQHAKGDITLGNLSNVEIVQIDSADTAGVTVNSTGVAGVTELSIVKAAGKVAATAGTSTDITLTTREGGVDSDGDPIALKHSINGGKNVNVTMTEMGNTSAANADTITVGENVAATGNVVVNAAGKTYDAAVGDLTMGAIKVTGGTTITVNQTAATSSAAAATDTSPSKVTQGAVDVITNASTTTVTVKQTADAEAKPGEAAKVGGVTETATVKFNALKDGESITLNGLTFKASEDMSATEVAAAFANLTKIAIPAGGDDSQSGGVYSKGTYTGDFDVTKWTSGAATGDTVVFTSTTEKAPVTDLNDSSLFTFPSSNTSTAPAFTIVQGVAATAGAVSGGSMGVATGVVTIDTTDADALKTVTVDGYAALSGITGTDSVKLDTVNLLNGGDFTITGAAETLALNLTKISKGAGEAAISLTNGTTKTVNVTTNGANAAALDLGDASAATTLNVSGTGLLTATGSDLADVTTIKVSGTAGLDLGATNRNKVTSVDTTGTSGDTTININGTASYAGGAGKDVVTVNNAGTAITKSINLGAGDDTLVLNGTIVVPKVDLKGGDGTKDTLSMTAANAVALTADGKFAAKIDGFEVLYLNDKATTAGTVDLANMDNINYVKSANSNAVAADATKATFTVKLAGTAGANDTIEFDGKSIDVAGLNASAIATKLYGTAFANWAATAVAGDTITFEAITAGEATTPPADADFKFNDDVATDDNVTFDVTTSTEGTDAGDAAAALTISNLVSGGTLELAGFKDAAGAIVKVTDATTGTADVLNVVTNSTVGTVTANDVETFNINAATASSVTVAGTAALTTINVTGAAQTLTLGAGTSKVATVNAAEATGALTLNLTSHEGVAVTVTGGKGNDELTASAGTKAHADVLNGGEGSDTLVAGSNGAKLTGGAGNDLYVLSAGNNEANTYSSVIGFAAGDLLQLKATANTNVDTFTKLSAELAETADFSNFVDAAIAQADAGDAVWFSFKGNAYVVIDRGDDAVESFENNVDSIIQLVGVNLDSASFNATYGTVGLI